MINYRTPHHVNTPGTCVCVGGGWKEEGEGGGGDKESS